MCLKGVLKIFSCAIMIVSVLAMISVAEEPSTQSKVGLCAYLQSSQFDIAIPMWIAHRAVLVPSVGVTSIEGKASDVRVALMVRFNLGSGKAVPYVGGRVGLMWVTPKYGESTQDMIVGPAVGGEYFLDDRFSLGVEAQVNAAISGEKSSRFGNPGGTNINTATAALMTFYF